MKLDLYAGNKRITTLVQWHPVDPVTQHIMAPKPDCYAIPGGHKTNEAKVRQWATEYGYTVKRRYDDWDYKEAE